MTVEGLINELNKYPKDLPVALWKSSFWSHYTDDISVQLMRVKYDSPFESNSTKENEEEYKVDSFELSENLLGIGTFIAIE